MTEPAFKFNEIRIFVDLEGREIHEIKPVNYTDNPQFAAHITIMTPMGLQPIRLVLRGAKNISEAFKLHDEVVDKLRQDMQEEMQKPQLLTPGDLNMNSGSTSNQLIL
jgi:hypothetical protein